MDIYNEIGRFGSYGMARKAAKESETELENGTRHYIFKDISNGPFTSFSSDAYVLFVGPEKIANDIQEDLEDE